MFALRHCALQCTALQKLVPNFSGNEFAYGQQHIVFWLSAIVTAIESASWLFGQLAASKNPLGIDCNNVSC